MVATLLVLRNGYETNHPAQVSSSPVYTMGNTIAGSFALYIVDIIATGDYLKR